MILRSCGRLSCVLALAALIGGCASGPRHHLADYDFSGGTLAVVFYDPPAPEIASGGISLGRGSLRTLASAGRQAARDVQAESAAARLDSAAANVQFADRVADRTLERSSRYLGTRPVAAEADADFVLEVDLNRIGLNTGSSPMQLFVSGEATLINALDGREIWRVPVSGSEPISRSVGNPVLNDIIGAARIDDLSVENFELLLGQLVEYTGDRIALILRDDLRDVRDG